MADYPIPPWLNPQTDWGAMAMRRSALKAQIAESGQKLAQDQLQFNQQMEMKAMAMQAEQKAQEQQLKQQAEIAKHRISVEQAYNQAKMGLEVQQLQQASRKIDLDYQQAERKFAAEQEFEDTLAKNLETMPPQDAFRDTLYRKGIKAGAPAAAFSAAKIVPPRGVGGVEINDIGQGLISVRQPSGSERVMKKPEFKFSGEKELRAIEADPFFTKYSSGKDYPGEAIKTKVEAQKKRRAELLDQLDKERRAFEGGGSAKTRRLTFDPVRGSYLTNSP
jgi:hypothetical protein